MDVERVARGLVQSGLDVIRDVRIAWAELDASGRRRRLRSRIDQIAGESAKLARSRQRFRAAVMVFDAGQTSAPVPISPFLKAANAAME